MDERPSLEFVRIIESLTNFIRNELVAAFNEGVDEERKRCTNIAEKYARNYKRTVNLNVGKIIAGEIRDLT